MRDLESLLQFILDHPSAKSDRRLGHDEDFLLTDDIEGVLHFCCEGMYDLVQAAPQGHGAGGHAAIFAQEAAVHDRNKFPVDLRDEAILVLNAIPLISQKLTVEA